MIITNVLSTPEGMFIKADFECEICGHKNTGIPYLEEILPNILITLECSNCSLSTERSQKQIDRLRII